MLFLGLSTASDYLSLAVLRDDLPLCDYSVLHRRKLLPDLIPTVERLLVDAGVSLAQIDVFCVSKGPGAFTGLRIGMTAAKTFAQVFEKPLVGVSTLDCMAYSVWRTSVTGSSLPICPVLNLFKHDLYYAIYHASNDGLYRLSEYVCGDTDGLASVISADTLLVFNRGASNWPHPRHSAALNARQWNRAVDWYSGLETARLGRTLFLTGTQDTPYTLTPLYLKGSAAESSNEAFERIRIC